MWRKNVSCSGRSALVAFFVILVGCGDPSEGELDPQLNQQQATDDVGLHRWMNMTLSDPVLTIEINGETIELNAVLDMSWNGIDKELGLLDLGAVNLFTRAQPNHVEISGFFEEEESDVDAAVERVCGTTPTEEVLSTIYDLPVERHLSSADDETCAGVEAPCFVATLPVAQFQLTDVFRGYMFAFQVNDQTFQVPFYGVRFVAGYDSESSLSLGRTDLRDIFLDGVATRADIEGTGLVATLMGLYPGQDLVDSWSCLETDKEGTPLNAEVDRDTEGLCPAGTVEGATIRLDVETEFLSCSDEE
jgi:hypothetical protein